MILCDQSGVITAPFVFYFIYVTMLQLIMFYIIMSHSTESREVVLITLHQS